MTTEAKQKTVEGSVPVANGVAESSSSKPMIRIIMADSQAIYRVGMRKVFAAEIDIQVVAQVDSLANLQTSIPHHPADVLVMEGNLLAGKANAIPDINVTAAVAAIRTFNIIILHVPRARVARLCCTHPYQPLTHRTIDD